MSDQMPISDLQTGAQPWVCSRCGRENKGSWTTCPGCESSRDGRPPAAAAPTSRRSASGLSVLLGLLVLAALVVLVVLVAPVVWQWVADQAQTFWTWVDSRT